MDQIDLLDDGRRYYPILDGEVDTSHELTRAQVELMKQEWPALAAEGILDFVDVRTPTEALHDPEPTESDLEAMMATMPPMPVPALLPEDGNGRRGRRAYMG